MSIPFGRYELLRRIAAGGMGEVYLARQAGLQGFEKLLVVKVLLPHLVEQEEFTTMFLDEARIAARLNHPNIAQIFDLGEVDGAYYIAMEYIHGDDIKRTWKRAHKEDKPVPLPLAVRIASDAAAGLDYAHKAKDNDNVPLGIIHRDVSPQNILLTFEGGVKLIDFGIAKAANRSVHTATGTLKGKYPYMSPEQATSKKLDHRSDIFALGVVLFEMATGKRLFAREDEISIIRAVADCDVPAPSEVNPKIDEHLEGVILKALAPTPDERFDDAQQLRLALEDWLTQTRQSGSSAHLGAYLQDLYADRLAEEREKGRPLTENDRTPSAVVGRSSLGPIGRGGTPAGQSASSGQGQGSTPDEELPATAVVSSPSPRAKRRWPLALGGLAMLGVVAAVLLLWPGDTPPASDDPSRKLTIITSPAGASVSLDGSLIGTTPIEGQPLPENAGGSLSIELDGHLPIERSIAAFGSPKLEFELEPKPAVAKPEPEEPEEPEEPPPPEMVTLSVSSRPAGARVSINGEHIGTTPFEHDIERSEEDVRLLFQRRGFRRAQQTISPVEDATVTANLRQVERPTRDEPDLDIEITR